MEKRSSMSSAEKLSLLDAFCNGTIQATGDKILFPTFYKQTKFIHSRSTQEISNFFKEIIEKFRPDTMVENDVRVDEFTKNHPNFLLHGGTKEEQEELQFLFEQVFIGDINKASSQGKENWQNFLDAIKDGDSNFINIYMQKKYKYRSSQITP